MKNGTPKNNFSMHFGKTDDVVLPQDLYFEPTDNVRSVFGLFDYLPYNQRIGELEHLLQLIYNSPTAQSICNKVASYTVGEGFYLLKERTILGDKKTQELSEAQKTQLWRILRRKNADGDCLLDVCRKAAFDYQATGNAFAPIDIISGITFISHQNVNFVRPFKALDFKTRIFGVSADWAFLPQFRMKGDQAGAAILDVPAYPFFSDRIDQLEDSEYTIGADLSDYYGFDRSSMLHVKRYAPLMYQWGLPSWTGAKHWVELEYRIPKFNVSRFKNGLTSSGLLQLFGDLTEDEKADYVREFKEKMTNTGNDFKVILQILENPELKANWQPFENTYTGYFVELADLAESRVATGFEFPIGLIKATPGQLGNNQQIRSEFEVLYRTKIYDIQQAILQGIVRPYLDTVADTESLDWLKDIELGFQNIIPVSFAGDIAVADFITQNEGRELIGYSELEAGELTITEEKATEQPQTPVNRFFNLFKKRKK